LRSRWRKIKSDDANEATERNIDTEIETEIAVKNGQGIIVIITTIGAIRRGRENESRIALESRVRVKKMDIDTSDHAILQISAMIGIIPTSAGTGGRVRTMNQNLQLRRRR
jgi:hypothetical protein